MQKKVQERVHSYNPQSWTDSLHYGKVVSGPSSSALACVILGFNPRLEYEYTPWLHALMDNWRAILSVWTNLAVKIY